MKKIGFQSILVFDVLKMEKKNLETILANYNIFFAIFSFGYFAKIVFFSLENKANLLKKQNVN